MYVYYIYFSIERSNNKSKNGRTRRVVERDIIKNVTLQKRKSNYCAITQPKNAVREIVIQLKNE